MDRPPNIVLNFLVKAKEIKVASPFGGLLYVVVGLFCLGCAAIDPLNKIFGYGRWHSTVVAFSPTDLSALGSVPSIPPFSEKNCQLFCGSSTAKAVLIKCLSLKISVAHQTHSVLAGSKPELQKNLCFNHTRVIFYSDMHCFKVLTYLPLITLMLFIIY